MLTRSRKYKIILCQTIRLLLYRPTRKLKNTATVCGLKRVKGGIAVLFTPRGSPFQWGWVWIPHLNGPTWAGPQTATRSVHPFCTAQPFAQQTDHATCDICSSRSYCVPAMPPKNWSALLTITTAVYSTKWIAVNLFIKYWNDFQTAHKWLVQKKSLLEWGNCRGLISEHSAMNSGCIIS